MPEVNDSNIDNAIWDTFKGIALIIDDQIGEDNDKISDIVNQLNELKVPLLKYKKIPEDEIIEHLKGISFVILDWKIEEDITEEGVTIPEGIFLENNIDFIKKIQDNFFCPIFIISNESIESIKTALKEKKLIYDNKPNFIFVANKGIDIKKQIIEWTKESNVVYTLKIFAHSLTNACKETFKSLYNIDAEWPNKFFTTSKADNVDFSYDILNLISANIKSRMKINLEKKFFKDLTVPKISGKDNKVKIKRIQIKPDIAKLISARTVLPEEILSCKDYNAGDLFLDGDKYYINIRPTCDSLRATELYLIEGVIIPNPTKDKQWENYKKVSKETSRYLVLCCWNNQHIEFDFKKFSIRKIKTLENLRIGRLLHPYITDMQRHFANYISRPGVYRNLTFDMLYEEIIDNN